MKAGLTEKDVVEIVRRELAELAFEQTKECDRHWKEEMPLALIFREMFRVLGMRAATRWGRSAKLCKWPMAEDQRA